MKGRRGRREESQEPAVMERPGVSKQKKEVQGGGPHSPGPGSRWGGGAGWDELLTGPSPPPPPALGPGPGLFLARG